jgi:hypothetical protein
MGRPDRPPGPAGGPRPRGIRYVPYSCAGWCVCGQGSKHVRNRRQRVPEVGGPHLQARQPGAAGPGPYHGHEVRDGGRGPGIGAAVRNGDQRRPGLRGRAPLRPGLGRPEPAAAGQRWMPHSVLPVPAHRPLRASAPASTRAVQVAQPIDG